MKLNYIGNEKINLEELHFEEVEILEDLLKEEFEEIKEYLNSPVENIEGERMARSHFKNKKNKISKMLSDIENWIKFIPQEYDNE